MRNKTLRITIGTLCALMLMSVAVFAGSGYSSSASISSSQSGAFGSYHPMYGTATLSGQNKAAATNTLYIASDSTTSGFTYKTYAVSPNNTLNATSFTIATGDYRVLLDPSGPLATGCVGNGKLAN